MKKKSEITNLDILRAIEANTKTLDVHGKVIESNTKILGVHGKLIEANSRSINDLAESLSGFIQYSEKCFDGIDRRFDGIENRLDGHDKLFIAIDYRLGNLEHGQKEIKDSLEEKVSKFEFRQLEKRVRLLESK